MNPETIMSDELDEVLAFANSDKKYLTAINKQRQHILKVWMLPKRPCWYCGKPVNWLEAAPKPFPLFGREEEPDFQCPHCEHKLHWVVPFIGDVRWGNPVLFKEGE